MIATIWITAIHAFIHQGCVRSKKKVY